MPRPSRRRSAPPSGTPSATTPHQRRSSRTQAPPETSPVGINPSNFDADSPTEVLQLLLQERHLPITGSRATLLARLRQRTSSNTLSAVLQPSQDPTGPQGLVESKAGYTTFARYYQRTRNRISCFSVRGRGSTYLNASLSRPVGGPIAARTPSSARYPLFWSPRWAHTPPGFLCTEDSYFPCSLFRHNISFQLKVSLH